MNSKAYFVGGINTDAGKTIATGMMARSLMQQGKSVITQKLIQTGCQGMSEDIVTHRKLMNMSLTTHDLDGTTCKYVLPLGASPHLAAKMARVNIDTAILHKNTLALQQHYDIVLIEGAGGLMVPINNRYTTLDYIVQHQLPVILVTYSKLGSINHTLMSLEMCRQRNIEVTALIYNLYPQENEIITHDTLQLFREYVSIYFPRCTTHVLPILNNDTANTTFNFNL